MHDTNLQLVLGDAKNHAKLAAINWPNRVNRGKYVIRCTFHFSPLFYTDLFAFPKNKIIH